MQSAFAAALGLLVLAGCQTIQYQRTPDVTAVDWPTDGKDASRARYVQELPEPPLEQVWEYNASAAFGPGSPLIYQDAVLVATRKGEMHKVGLEDGRKQGFKGFGDAIEGSPLISDGTLYVTNSWGRNVLLAYDLRRGSVRWKARGVPFETALIDGGDTVIGVDVEGVIRAYAKDDGREVWRTDLGGRVSVQASPVSVGADRFAVATDRGELVLIDSGDGSLIWSTDVGAPVYNTPAVADDLIVVPTTRGKLVAVDARSGGIAWRFVTDDVETKFASPALGDGRALVGTSDAEVIALSLADGALLWTMGTDDAIVAPALLSGGVAYVGTMGRKLLGLDPEDGVLLWETETTGRIKSGLAVRDGMILILTDQRRLEAFAPVSSAVAQLNEDSE